MSISTNTTIQHGAAIEYRRVQFRDFWSHRIIVTTTGGQQHTLDVFAYKPIDLEWLPNDQASEMRTPPVEPSEVATA
jgi:hypothetical protein